MTTASITGVLYRQRALLIFLFIIVFCGSWVGLNYLPPIYQVKASVQVNRRSGLDRLDILTEDAPVNVSNIVQRLKSSTLFENTLKKLGSNLSPGSKEFIRLHQKLSVKELRPSNIIEITFTHRSSEYAARVVNELIDLFIEENGKRSDLKVEESISYIKTKLEYILREKMEIAVEIKRLSGTSQPQVSNKFINDVNADILFTKQEIARLESRLESPVRITVKNAFAGIDWDSYHHNLYNLEKQLVGILIRSNWNNPAIKKLQIDIWKEKSRLASIIESQITNINNLSSNTLKDICAFQVKLYDLNIRRAELLKLGANPDSISQKQTELRALEKLENQLIVKLTELQTTGKLSDVEISWVDRAVPLQTPIFPRFSLTLGFSFFAAVFVCLLIFNLGLFFEEIRSEDYKA